jgi:hypothetical protein
MRVTAEFNAFLEHVRYDALDPANRQRLQQFNLTHQDALKADPLSAAQLRQAEEGAGA